MKKQDTAYLSMTSTVMQELARFETVWNTNEPFKEEVDNVKAMYAALSVARQGSNQVSTGASEDKEAAAEAAISKAVTLAGFVQVYAQKNNNMTLYEQMKITHSDLDVMPDETLVQCLKDLYQRMVELGDPIVKYGATAAQLTKLDNAIQLFDGMKSAPRLAINSRKGHNQTMPANLRSLKASFEMMDRLIHNWDEDNPAFVQAYLNARQVINPGGRNKPDDKKPGDKNPDA